MAGAGSVAAGARFRRARGTIKSWQGFGSGAERLISVEEFGGEKWSFGVTEFVRGGRE